MAEEVVDEEVKKRNKLDDLDERSDQVREILGRAPGWVIRWGITVVFIIVGVLLLGAALISYNDIIPARIVITTQNPPVYLDAKTGGRLTNIFVAADQLVKRGEVLAEIENTADFNDVYYLKTKIENFKPVIDNTDSLRKQFPSFLKLGPIQLAYGSFITEYQNFILFNSLKPNKKESAVIARQISEQRELLDKQKEQLSLFKEELAFSKNDYERNRTLFDRGVLSKSEFESASRNYLADRQRYENLKTSISNTEISIASNNNLLTQTDIQGEEFTNNYLQQLEKAYQNLINEIRNWEQLYILESPIDGKITIFDIWNKYQRVNTGEVLFTIVPQDYKKIIGKVAMPIQNSGKVKLGQKVIIKLDNYPNQEWGSLTGTITNISDVPKQQLQQEPYYSIYVDINGLTTSYDKKIDFKQEMQGSAEIVVEELTVLQRIFYQLREIFDRAEN